jgi:hypothetical protein
MGRGGGRRSRGIRTVKRELLTGEEIGSLDHQEVLVCMRGLKVRGTWRNAYRDRRFT